MGRKFFWKKEASKNYVGLLSGVLISFLSLEDSLKKMLSSFVSFSRRQIGAY